MYVCAQSDGHAADASVPGDSEDLHAALAESSMERAGDVGDWLGMDAGSRQQQQAGEGPGAAEPKRPAVQAPPLEARKPLVVKMASASAQ